MDHYYNSLKKTQQTCQTITYAILFIFQIEQINNIFNQSHLFRSIHSLPYTRATLQPHVGEAS